MKTIDKRRDPETVSPTGLYILEEKAGPRAPWKPCCWQKPRPLAEVQAEYDDFNMNGHAVLRVVAWHGGGANVTLSQLNRISGLLLSILFRTDRDGDDYADRMLRHAISCICKAKAALKRGDEAEAHRLTSWAYGSARMALGK